jgi:hypothetical protein
MSYKRHDLLLTIREHVESPPDFGGSVLLIFLVFVFWLSSSCVLCAQIHEPIVSVLSILYF